MGLISGAAEMSYPPDIDESERERLVQTIKDWSIAHGLAVRPPPAVVASDADPQGILATNVPVTLFPSPFAQSSFEEGKAVQKAYNKLYADVSRDEAFLDQIVQEVSGDEFISQLWAVHQRVKSEGYTQKLSLGLFRSDYMVHQDTVDGTKSPQIKQVEFNTIASSFGGLSSKTCELHRFLATTEYPQLKQSNANHGYNLPENNSAKGLAAGLKAAHDAYGESALGHQRCVLFLTQRGERNVFDQRHLEYALQSLSPGIPIFRLPFAEILQQTSIAQTESRQLLYKSPINPDKVFEVSVIYLRAGYGPGDYPSPADWDARYQIERSNAIKCPTVLSQLAGAKKVQQVLATPVAQSQHSELHRFLPDGSDASKQIRKTFTHIYPLDDSEAGQEARKLALDPKECLKYVLKPQREGGGNNYYKAKIPAHLNSIPEESWKSYILMELITPPPVANVILRNGNLEQGGVICELGIYGTCVWNQSTGDIVHNEEAGYLLRTKGDQSEEGGVAAGFGCMDSCTLV